MSRVIGVGFGEAGCTRDGVLMWSERAMLPDEEHPSAGDVEAIAALDPDHDWRIFFHAPLYSAIYQRQGPALWVLVEKGDGFA